jgi:hypothetical protein
MGDSGDVVADPKLFVVLDAVEESMTKFSTALSFVFSGGGNAINDSSAGTATTSGNRKMELSAGGWLWLEPLPEDGAGAGDSSIGMGRITVCSLDAL